LTKQYKLKLGAPQPYSDEALVQVERLYAGASRQLDRYEAAQQGIVQNFSQQVTGRLEKINTATSELFPPERWDAPESHEGKLVESVKQGIRDLGASEANPLFALLAKTGAALMLERQYRQSLESKTAKAKSIQSDIKKAGPTGSATVSGGGKKSGNGDDFDYEGTFRGFTQSGRSR
jgi:hypothetical protein